MLILDVVFLVALGLLAAIGWILETDCRGPRSSQMNSLPASSPTG